MPVFNECLSNRLYEWCVRRNPDVSKIIVKEWLSFVKEFENMDIYEACKKLETEGYEVDESSIQMFGFDPYRIIMHNVGLRNV